LLMSFHENGTTKCGAEGDLSD